MTVMLVAPMELRATYTGRQLNMNEEDIIGFSALYESMQKCKKNVLWKDSVASFYLNGIERCIRLSDQLKNGKYKAAPPRKFTITCPKRRDVVSIAFRDRVYQRSLNDNEVYPKMAKPLIYANCACQKGKGTDMARNLLKKYLRRMYRKYGNDFYVLKIDIKGYYPSMDHGLVEEHFKRYLPEWAHKRTSDIFRHQYSGEKGYYAGSQLVQIAGISFLNDIDHYIKEELHIKYYIRYQDDFILLHEDTEYLNYCMIEIGKRLTELRLTMHPKKTKITEISEGIEFLGFNFKLSGSGKVIILINSRNVKQRRKKMFRAYAQVRKGNLSKEKPEEMNASWYAHLDKGNCYKVKQRMIKYCENIKEAQNDSQ